MTSINRSYEQLVEISHFAKAGNFTEALAIVPNILDTNLRNSSIREIVKRMVMQNKASEAIALTNENPELYKKIVRTLGDQKRLTKDMYTLLQEETEDCQTLPKLYRAISLAWASEVASKQSHL